MAFRTLSSQARVTHVLDKPKLFVASKSLRSRPRVIHVNHNLEMFTVSIALSTLPQVIEDQNPNLFIAFRALSSDPKELMSSITLSCS